MRRWSFIALAGVCAMGMMVFGILNAGHWLSAPRAVPAQSDLIVVLGGGAGPGRIQIALELYQRGYADKILLTGMSKANHSLHWETRFLLEGGVKSGAMLFDDQSKNSYDEANNTALLMKNHQWKTALVVSDPPHLRRLVMVWGPACVRQGLEYRLIGTESPTWNASRWWHDRAWAKFVGMELLKLSYYVMAYS